MGIIPLIVEKRLSIQGIMKAKERKKIILFESVVGLG